MRSSCRVLQGYGGLSSRLNPVRMGFRDEIQTTELRSRAATVLNAVFADVCRASLSERDLMDKSMPMSDVVSFSFEPLSSSWLD